MRLLVPLAFVLLGGLAACGPKAEPVAPDSPPWTLSRAGAESPSPKKQEDYFVSWEERMPDPPWRRPWRSPELRRPERVMMRFVVELTYGETWMDGDLGGLRVVDEGGRRIWQSPIEMTDLLERRVAAQKGTFCAYPEHGYRLRLDPEKGREPLHLEVTVSTYPPQSIFATILGRGVGDDDLPLYELDRGAAEGVVRGVRARYGRRDLIVMRVGAHDSVACEVAEPEHREGTRVPEARVTIEGCPELLFSRPEQVCREGFSDPKLGEW